MSTFIDRGSSQIGTAEDLGFDPEGGKWVVVCTTHYTVINVPTLKYARGTFTPDFCEECTA